MMNCEPWSDALKARLMTYCRIDVPEDGDEELLKTLYFSAAAYLAGAGVSEPEAGTLRRAQYDLCVNYLVLDSYDRRGAQTEGSISDNPVFLRLLTQLKLTEPVSESDT